mmetsp:Transcript_25567/g.59523  ORF Transcript_25567/g.59523 Transcript_25567/m.59523 type:complete len:357 (-) Transcript_25567:88-1158(-)
MTRKTRVSDSQLKGVLQERRLHSEGGEESAHCFIRAPEQSRQPAAQQDECDLGLAGKVAESKVKLASKPVETFERGAPPQEAPEPEPLPEPCERESCDDAAESADLPEACTEASRAVSRTSWPVLFLGGIILAAVLGALPLYKAGLSPSTPSGSSEPRPSWQELEQEETLQPTSVPPRELEEASPSETLEPEEAVEGVAMDQLAMSVIGSPSLQCTSQAICLPGVADEWAGDLLKQLSTLRNVVSLGTVWVQDAGEGVRDGELVAVKALLTVRNIGMAPWPAHTNLRAVLGEDLGLQALLLDEDVPVNVDVELELNLQVRLPLANADGPRQSAWVLEAEGEVFGPLLVIEILEGTP